MRLLFLLLLAPAAAAQPMSFGLEIGAVNHALVSVPDAEELPFADVTATTTFEATDRAGVHGAFWARFPLSRPVWLIVEGSLTNRRFASRVVTTAPDYTDPQTGLPAGGGSVSLATDVSRLALGSSVMASLRVPLGARWIDVAAGPRASWLSGFDNDAVVSTAGAFGEAVRQAVLDRGRPQASGGLVLGTQGVARVLVVPFGSGGLHVGVRAEWDLTAAEQGLLRTEQRGRELSGFVGIAF